MDNRLYEKLRSKSGSSLVIVLILFFLCVMVSSVVVAAATSGASRNVNRKEQQQGYLSMISAVELLVKEIQENNSFVGVEVEKDYACNETGTKKLISTYELIDKDSHEDELVSNGTAVKSVDFEQTSLECAFGELLLNACTQIYENQSAIQDGYTAKFTISAIDERFADVYCVFTMDDNYNIKITMKLTRDDTEATSYAMTLNFTGQKQISTEHEILTCVHNIKSSIEQGDGSLKDENIPLELEGELRKTYTGVTWELPIVKKGEGVEELVE